MGISTGRRPTVVLVDDHPGFLRTIRLLVQSECDVVAAFADGQDVVEAVCSLAPDVVVLDIAMPVVGGITVARRLVSRGVNTKILFLTAMEDLEVLLMARELGAELIVKRRMLEELMPAIRAAVK